MQIGIECGQSLWRLRSWRRPWWRKLTGRGFACGPIMIMEKGN